MSDRPNGSTGESFGFTQPHVLDWSTPSTTMPRPLADSAVPTPSSRGLAPLRGASAMKRVVARMNATSTTSPANTTRHDSSVVAQPPTIGPTAMPAPATPPITA